jgi:hypothetical protein
MPLMTRLIRDGQPLVLPWTWQYLAACQHALGAELDLLDGDAPIVPPGGSYTFKHEHKFFWEERPLKDEPPVEVMFTIYPRDRYEAWRS